MHRRVGRNAFRQLDCCDSERPNIRLEINNKTRCYQRIVLLFLNDLWSHPKGSSNERFSLLCFITQLNRHSKVSQLGNSTFS